MMQINEIRNRGTLRLSHPGTRLATAALLVWLGSPVDAQPQLQMSAPNSIRGGQTFNVDIVANNASGIDAFGFELRFNANLLSYTGVQKGALTQGFNQLLGNQPRPGLVRIGGYGLSAVAGNSGILCRISFTAKTGVEDETVLALRSAVDFPQPPTLEPIRLRILREQLSGSGMAVGNERSLRNKSVDIPVEGLLPSGKTLRGAKVRLLFDASVISFVSAAQGSQVPSGYTLTAQSPSAGVLDLELSTPGGNNLTDGQLWLATFQVKANAPLGLSAITIATSSSYFVDSPGANQLALAVARAGSLFVHPKGDANHSGEITVADVLTALLGTLSNAYADQFTDCNETNQTTVDDIVCVITALFTN